MRLIPLSITLALLCLLVSSLSSISCADKPKQDTLTARQIFERMAETYATCKSYLDSGAVKTVFIQAGGKQTVEKPFKTAFVRPDHFRFEYKEKTDDNREYCHIIWRKGNDVQVWWDVTPGIERYTSLDLALAGATGVSNGSAHTIPALLMPAEIFGRRLTDMTETKRIEDAKLDKVDCFRIEGKFADNPMTLWIDKKKFLVRRIDSHLEFGSFRTVDTTIYNPVINEEITNRMLEFNPPEQN